MPLYKSNATQITARIIKTLYDATDQKQLVEVASEQLLGDIQYRIWTDYKATNGSLIGNYSTDPFYASIEFNSSLVRSIGAGRGKNSNKATFKNGKPRKSKYYKGGYKQYKKDIKGTTKVNLEVTGRLKNSFRRKVKGNIAIIDLDTYGQEVGAALQEKYGKDIFYASEDEINAAIHGAEEHIKTKLNKL